MRSHFESNDVYHTVLTKCDYSFIINFLTYSKLCLWLNFDASHHQQVMLTTLCEHSVTTVFSIVNTMTYFKSSMWLNLMRSYYDSSNGHMYHIVSTNAYIINKLELFSKLRDPESSDSVFSRQSYFILG